MPERRKKFTPEFKDEAVRMVIESSRPIAEVAREIHVSEGTLGNWCAKASRKHTEHGEPVHSFTSLLDDLGTICANRVQPTSDTPTFTMITTPTPLQRRAFQLLGVSHRLGYT